MYSKEKMSIFERFKLSHRLVGITFTLLLCLDRSLRNGLFFLLKISIFSPKILLY